jgi:hypothetical protein
MTSLDLSYMIFKNNHDNELLLTDQQIKPQSLIKQSGVTHQIDLCRTVFDVTSHRFAKDSMVSDLKPFGVFVILESLRFLGNCGFFPRLVILLSENHSCLLMTGVFRDFSYPK